MLTYKYNMYQMSKGLPIVKEIFSPQFLMDCMHESIIKDIVGEKRFYSKDFFLYSYGCAGSRFELVGAVVESLVKLKVRFPLISAYKYKNGAGDYDKVKHPNGYINPRKCLMVINRKFNPKNAHKYIDLSKVIGKKVKLPLKFKEQGYFYLNKYGPLEVHLYFHNMEMIDALLFGVSGIIRESDCVKGGITGHSFTLIGYSKKKIVKGVPMEVWKVMNSWNDGLLFLEIKDDVGNTCGILNDVNTFENPWITPTKVDIEELRKLKQVDLVNENNCSSACSIF